MSRHWEWEELTLPVIPKEKFVTGAIAKWLRRQIRNLFLFEGAGSNPAGVELFFPVNLRGHFAYEQLLIDVNQMSENSKFICTATSKQMC